MRASGFTATVEALPDGARFVLRHSWRTWTAAGAACELLAWAAMCVLLVVGAATRLAGAAPSPAGHPVGEGVLCAALAAVMVTGAVLGPWTPLRLLRIAGRETVEVRGDTATLRWDRPLRPRSWEAKLAGDRVCVYPSGRGWLRRHWEEEMSPGPPIGAVGAFAVTEGGADGGLRVGIGVGRRAAARIVEGLRDDPDVPAIVLRGRASPASPPPSRIPRGASPRG